jgi:hypothetical protein
MAFCCVAALLIFGAGNWITGQIRRKESEKAIVEQ